MSRIKFITDSASDITKEDAERLGIDLRCFPITVGEKSFRDGDIPKDEYYKLIDDSPELPVHSQLTVFEFEELYGKYADEGYEDIFFISINAAGSATYQNACLARDNYFSEHPDKKDSLRIRFLDSQSYSATYGYPVMKAAEMACEGTSADEIENYLADWFDASEVYLAAYTLRFVKKSGRISAAAAFAGELLGLKPVILLKGEETKVVAKPRGAQNLIPKLADVTCERIAEGSPYIVIGGKNMDHTKELSELLTQRLGYPPVDTVFRVGGAIAANSGPDIIAAAFKAKK